MSFASEVKKELLGINELSCCKKASTCGIMAGITDVTLTSKGMKLTMKSPMANVIRFLLPTLKKDFLINPQITYSQNNLNKDRIYTMEIIDSSDKIIDYYHLLPFDSLTLDDELLENECCKKAFVRGSFIARGSINDPRKSGYHLEILFKKSELAKLSLEILKDNSIECNVINKKNQYLLYIKKSEEISKMLAFMGATTGVFHFEDYRIYRDLSNNVNRTINCDIANGNKSMLYCQKQLEAIEYLEKTNRVNKLTERLQDAIHLRKEYPDSSLSELSEFSSNILGKEMSKSGISHCLKEIMNYYELVKKSNE